ncbi:MAG TPA: hypothetical protein DEQ02_02700, partial [Ruminococcaceae bacterium]|nr:hypothetical protein [Oscillospiraceae bacterium]
MGFRTVRARLAAVLTILAIFSAGVFVFVQSAAAAEGIFRGLTLCAEIIIPSLFVFMALCSFIIKSGAARILGNIFGPAVKLLFNLPKCAGPALLMSAAGGYPIGVRSAYELYKAGELSKLQAGRTALIAVNAGPAFIVGAVGEGMLLNRKSGFILLFAHLLSSLLLGIFSGIIWRRQDRAAGLYPKRLTVNPAASTPQNKRPASLMDSFV